MMRAASSGVRAALRRRLTSKKAARVRSARGYSAGSQALDIVLPPPVLDLDRRGRMQPEALHPSAVHLDHLESVRAHRDPIAGARQPPELAEDVAAEGGIVGVVERGVKLGVELGDRHRAVEPRGAVAAG